MTPMSGIEMTRSPLWAGGDDRIDGSVLASLLEHAVRCEASDIHIQVGKPVWLHVHGIYVQASRRKLTSSEVGAIIAKIYGDNATAVIKGGRPIDVAYELRSEALRQRVRFRVNAVGCQAGSESGLQITIRTIPSVPPTLSDLDVEDELVDALYPRQGLILVTGPTASGKSTLLAGAIRDRVEQPEAHCKVVTYEAPIEYVYDQVEGPSSFVSQSSVPDDVPTFYAAVENAMRRAPQIIMIGESRSPDTMGACASASLSGHLTYTTLHSNGVVETIQRIASMFPGEGRAAATFDVMESLRLVVTQNLVPCTAGGRIGVREFLVFDDRIRRDLLDTPSEKWSARIRSHLEVSGQTMLAAVTRLAENGLVSPDTLLAYRQRDRLGATSDRREAA